VHGIFFQNERISTTFVDDLCHYCANMSARSFLVQAEDTMKLSIVSCLCLMTITASLSPGAQAQTKSAYSSIPTSADWVDARFDAAHSGFNPLEQILTTDNVTSLVFYKNYNLRAATLYSFSSPPVLVNGVLYAGANNTLSAIDTATGSLLWKFQASVNSLYGMSSPTVVNGVVYVSAQNPQVLYALNATTGKVLWTASNTSFSPPTVANGLVYVSVLNTVYALNASNGSVVWQYQYQSLFGANVGEITVSGGLAYGTVLGPYNRDVIALDARSGQLVWDQSNLSWNPGSEVAAGSGKVFFTESAQIHALDATTGTVVWSYGLDDSANGPPAVANGVVYTVSDLNTVYAFDAGTGNVLWQHSASGPIFGTLVVANGVVYVGTDRNAYALNASNGDQLWEHDGVYTWGSFPLVVNGVLYVAASHGNIDSFHLPDGH
jgi:eukaryotic-like serine/threonine-protein kinase